MKRLNHSLKRLVKRLGFEVTRYQPRSNTLAKKFDLMHRLGVDLVLDVGANVGQFTRELRGGGYRGRVISFEPLSEAFATLNRNAGGDPSWESKNFAIGSDDRQQQINISARDSSSSLMEVTSISVDAHPESRSIASETIEVRRLDSVFDDLNASRSNIFLKVDTQGYELEVLKGAERSLERVVMLQLEMSFVPLYKGQPLFQELHHWVEERGFHLGSLESLHWHPQTSDLLWLDGVYHRSH